MTHKPTAKAFLNDFTRRGIGPDDIRPLADGSKLELFQICNSWAARVRLPDGMTTVTSPVLYLNTATTDEIREHVMESI